MAKLLDLINPTANTKWLSVRSLIIALRSVSLIILMFGGIKFGIKSEKNTESLRGVTLVMKFYTAESVRNYNI